MQAALPKSAKPGRRRSFDNRSHFAWTSRRASSPSPSGGNRRVLFNELALLQLRPELRRDPGLHGAVVSDDLLLAGGADNQGRGDIRRCGKLQRRRPEIDAVAFRYLAQLFAPFYDRLRDLVVFLAVIVPLCVPKTLSELMT